MCFLWTSGECEGIGAYFECLPCTQVLRGLQNYAKYAAPSLAGGHVTFMPIFGSFDVIMVTWGKYSMLIGRDNFCCAVIGQSYS